MGRMGGMGLLVLLMLLLLGRRVLVEWTCGNVVGGGCGSFRGLLDGGVLISRYSYRSFES